MDKPDQLNSQICQQFVDQFKLLNRQKNPELEALKYQGPLVFEDTDPICNTTNPLDRIAVQLVRSIPVTEKYFRDKFYFYSLQEKSMEVNKIATNRSNMLRMMKRGHITFNRFMEFSCLILGLKLDLLQFNFSSTEVNPNGEPDRYNLAVSDFDPNQIKLESID